MLPIYNATAPDFRAFTPDDLKTFKASRLPAFRAPGWALNLDRDETFDLISISLPPKGRAFPVDGFHPNEAYLITPAPAGQSGVLMASPGQYHLPDVAYPSLADALAKVPGMRVRRGREAV
jgi:hypothetical protein